MNILVTSMIDLETSAHNRLHQFLDYLYDNHEITVVSINDFWKKQNECKAERNSDNFLTLHPKIKVIHYTEEEMSPIIQEVTSSIHIKSVLKELDLSSFDVHFNYNGMCGGYAIAKLLKKHGIPTVYDIADNLPAMIATSPQLPSILKLFGGIFGNMYYYKNIKIAEKVTVTTKGLGCSAKVSDKKMVVIPNGVDTSLFHIQDCGEIRKDNSLNASFVIGYVGVLREWVDFTPLFEAVKKLYGKYRIKILIVGDGPDLNKIKELATRFDISNSVIFIGYVPYVDVPKYISAMDLCVIPFKTDLVAKDSLPLKLFEYMACERPVISSKIDAVVEDMSELVRCAENSEEYANFIAQYADNQSLRETFGRNGREFVEHSYAWDAISKKLENVLF